MVNRLKNKISLESCPHFPHVMIKTFSVADEEKKYKLCADCTKLEPYNKFLLEETPIKKEVTNNGKTM